MKVFLLRRYGMSLQDNEVIDHEMLLVTKKSPSINWFSLIAFACGLSFLKRRNDSSRANANK